MINIYTKDWPPEMRSIHRNINYINKNGSYVLPFHDGFLIQYPVIRNNFWKPYFVYLRPDGNILFFDTNHVVARLPLHYFGTIGAIDKEVYCTVSYQDKNVRDIKCPNDIILPSGKNWTLVQFFPDGSIKNIGKKTNIRIKEEKTCGIDLRGSSAIICGNLIKKKLPSFYIRTIIGEVETDSKDIIIANNTGMFPLDYKIMQLNNKAFDCAISHDGLTACFLTTNIKKHCMERNLEEIVIIDL